MEFSVEGLIIAIFAILPGFVSAAVQAWLKPDERSSTGEWVAGSIVTSLALNAIVLAVFFFVRHAPDLDQPVSGLKDQLGSISSWIALTYLAALYGIALVWGFAAGFAGQAYAPKMLAYRFRLTPVVPEASVFRETLQRLLRTRENRRLRGDPRFQVGWLRVQRGEIVILGRLRRSNNEFKSSEPIEVFLDPAYLFKRGELVERAERIEYGDHLRGLYLRLLQDDVVEVLIAPTVWNPLAGAIRSDDGIMDVAIVISSGPAPN